MLGFGNGCRKLNIYYPDELSPLSVFCFGVLAVNKFSLVSNEFFCLLIALSYFFLLRKLGTSFDQSVVIKKQLLYRYIFARNIIIAVSTSTNSEINEINDCSI